MLLLALILAAPGPSREIPAGPFFLIPGEKGYVTVAARRCDPEGFEVIWEGGSRLRGVWSYTRLWDDDPHAHGMRLRTDQGVPLEKIPPGVDGEAWVRATVSFALCRFDEARRALEALRQDGLGEEARARIDALLAGCDRGKEALAPFLSVKRPGEARAVVEKAEQVYRELHDTDLGLPAYLAYRHVKDLLFRNVEDFEIGQTKEYVRPGQKIIEIVSDPVFEGVHARSLFHGEVARDWETIDTPGVGDWTPYRELTFRARMRAGGSQHPYKVTIRISGGPDIPEYLEYLVSRRSLRFDGRWRLYRFDIRRDFYPAREMAGYGALSLSPKLIEKALSRVDGLIFVRLGPSFEEPIFVDDMRLGPLPPRNDR